MERSIEIRDTGIAVTDILELIAQGYSYHQILLRHNELTLADIMLSAKLARELIGEFVTSESTIRVEGNISLTASGGRVVNLTRMREEFPRAFEPWTATEDRELVEQFHNKLPIVDMARLHGRKPGAIRTRLKKLGLLGTGERREGIE